MKWECLFLSEFSYRLRRFLYQDFTPVTKTVALVSGAIFLLSAFIPLDILARFLSLDPSLGFVWPWTLVTYPFFNGSIREFISLLFSLLWLWFIGGSLERSWGSKTYGLLLFLTTLLTGVSMSIVGLIHLTANSYVYGLWLPLVGLTWAWAEIGPDQEVLLMGIIPIKARWLAWVTVAVSFFTFFQKGTSLIGQILFGLASISGIAVTYLFTGKGPLSRGYRYWAWQRKASPGGRGEQPKRKPGRRKLRVIK
jgi:membrane associated rhomboid family serine protease